MTKKEQDPFMELSDVVAREVRWLFEPYIPYSMISIIEGDPGLGKSFLAMHIAAQITIGGKLPNGQRLPVGKVVYLSAEDDNAYTIRPRMEAMGADLDQVIVLREFMGLDETGLAALREEIESARPTIVVLDPMIAFMEAGSDPYRPTVIRPFLNALRNLAEEFGPAVLIVRHLAKARHGNALYQGTGSIDQIGVARSAMRVAMHPDDDSLRVMAHIKHNLSAKGPSLLFEVVHEPDGATVAWRGETDLTIADLDGAPSEDQSDLDTAESFLRDALKDGPVPAARLLKAADARSISKRTLERAKERLRIKSTKSGTSWNWKLPAST